MQTKTIAVITAPNMRFVNTGMTTVELAARSFLSRAFPATSISFFSTKSEFEQTLDDDGSGPSS
jgi:hypothetical protein